MRRLVLLAACALVTVACGTQDPFARGEVTIKPDDGKQNPGGGGNGGGTGGTGGDEQPGGSGGGEGGAGGGGIGVSFTADVVPILEADCAACHAGGVGGLTITGDASSDYDNVISRVVPGDTEGSLLVNKGRGMGHGGGAIWSEGDENDSVVDAWIAVGAPNN